MSLHSHKTTLLTLHTNFALVQLLTTFTRNIIVPLRLLSLRVAPSLALLLLTYSQILGCASLTYCIFFLALLTDSLKSNFMSLTVVMDSLT